MVKMKKGWVGGGTFGFTACPMLRLQHSHAKKGEKKETAHSLFV